MPTKQVSFTDPQTERSALERRRLLAEHLMAQSQQGAPPEWQGQRIMPEYGIGHGLTQLGQALIGRNVERGVSRREDELNTSERKAYADRLRGMVAPDAQIRMDDVQGGPSTTTTVPRRPTPQQESAIQSVNQLPLEAQQNILGQASVSQLFPKSPEPYTLSAGQQRRGANNEVLAEVPPKPGGETGQTGSLQEIAAINEFNRRKAAGEIREGEVDPSEYLSARRGTSADKQLYSEYILGLPDGAQPLPMNEFLVQHRGKLAGAETEAKAAVIPADDRITAQNKLPRVEAAQRRLERVLEASAALENNTLSGGPMQGGVIGLTEEGNELDQANAQLLTELTALTRTPGIGSQSDFEQRLQNLVLPSADMYPSVRRKAIAELQAFMEDLSYEIQRIGSGEPPQAQGAGSIDSLLDKYAPVP